VIERSRDLGTWQGQTVHGRIFVADLVLRLSSNPSAGPPPPVILSFFVLSSGGRTSASFSVDSATRESGPGKGFVPHNLPEPNGLPLINNSPSHHLIALKHCCRLQSRQRATKWVLMQACELSAGNIYVSSLAQQY
jgi:hypothetical protein